jgi:hypothetical protein
MLDKDDEEVIKDAKGGGAVLVTFDRVLREAAGGMTPYEALNQAQLSGQGSKQAQDEVSRLILLSPKKLSRLGDAGDETIKYFRQTMQVSLGSAKMIRHLRVEKNFSWRAIARYYSLVQGGDWGGNQLAGIVICEKAAQLTGEDFIEPPWN